MTALAIQRGIAAVFVLLGGWALFHPVSVIALGLEPEYREGAGMHFAVGCFGAQALIAGLFAATARFTAATFVGYGLMLAGFLAFDWYFCCVVPVLSPLGAAIDAAGNLAMMALCWLGWRDLRRRASRPSYTC